MHDNKTDKDWLSMKSVESEPNDEIGCNGLGMIGKDLDTNHMLVFMKYYRYYRSCNCTARILLLVLYCEWNVKRNNSSTVYSTVNWVLVLVLRTIF